MIGVIDEYQIEWFRLGVTIFNGLWIIATLDGQEIPIAESNQWPSVEQRYQPILL